MHPARSIILFTTLSGAGYGALAWMGVLLAVGALPGDPLLGLVGGALALGLAAAGLLCSTFHLRHPERAWRALSQWRSSWLSREGVLALATFVPALLFLGGWAIGAMTAALPVLGLVTAVGALATIVCTAMIYRSLWTVPQWHNGWTVPGFVLLALASGGLVLCAALALTGAGAVYSPVPPVVTLGAVLAAAAVKAAAWQAMGRAVPQSDTTGAVGLTGRASAVRLVEAPNSSETWLQREMMFQVARRHAAKLRRITAVLGLAVVLLVIAACWLPAGVADAACAVLAACAGLLAVTVERWLFFAGARHKVSLYHGTERV